MKNPPKRQAKGKTKMILHDTHLHTECSHDSRQSVDELCRAANARALASVTVTDHADMGFYAERDIGGRIARSFSSAKEARGRYGSLEVLAGVELGDYFDAPERSRELLAAHDFDSVIGSTHCLFFAGEYQSPATVDFSHIEDSVIADFLTRYFESLLALTETGLVNILAHLTYPLRYICIKYGRRVDIEDYRPVIDEIFRAVIARGMALEVNTSASASGILIPDEALLTRYRTLGGERITVGSDAHIPENVGLGFSLAERTLRTLGFAGYTYYRRREPVFVPFD